MRKGRRWRVLQQTCNVTPCSLYRPTGHNSTSSTSLGGPDRPRRGRPAPDRVRRDHPRPDRNCPVPRSVQRTWTRSPSGRLFGRRSRRPPRKPQPRGTSSAASRRPFRTRGKAGEQPVELITGQSRGITSWRRPAPSELMRTLIPHSTIPHGDGSSPYRIRETPPGHPQNNLSDVEKIILGRPWPPSGNRPPLPPHRRLPGPFDPAPADLVHMHPAAPTDTGADPAPRPPSGAPPTDRQPRGRRPFRRPGKDR